MFTRHVLFPTMAAALLAVAACDGSKSPTAPSGLTHAAVASAGATIDGTVAGATGPVTVTVVGTNVSARIDASGGFRLTGVPPGTVQLLFTGPGVNATVVIQNVGQQQRVQVEVTISGGAATLDNEQRSSSANAIELSGQVRNLAGSCPTLTFTITGTTVTTDGATLFEDGACSDVQNGTEVDVEGVQQPDGSVRATEVKLEDVELEGTVTGLSGSCPNLSFMITGTTVTTDAATVFDDGGCAELANGTPVRIDGLRQADGSVRATEIEVDEVKLVGSVAGLSGSCPTLMFSLNGTTVITDGATVFEDGNCTDIENGTSVEVEGQLQPDGSVRATEVDIGEVKLEGTVAGVAGSCPTLTFTVDGTTVTTDAATRFDDGACSDMQNGFEVEVRGLVQPDGTLRATRVKLEIEEVEIEGAVASLGGSCPNLNFTVNGTTVTTNPGTTFEDGACSDVQNGVEVEVEGLRQPDGSVRATEVELED